ncbi:DUF805 domain-containing protein [Rhodobacteraceae bacterium N5(2021)]|uniref:DUF805 domain-containing protein n=1 Tax=Gymnodinialimonas phycosphaerae TaxID=2841589 RepID=A0A975TVK3_9RHOB|nr:DUF805 domain-containing protein [Gymnodinialimonas phycosphaerae]MBY4894893.1 DUF805 domain-containing protein [Gymnodinialimonas phycosphaerae]
MNASSAQTFGRLVSFRGRAGHAEFWAVVGLSFAVMLPAFLTEFRWLFWTTHEYTAEVTRSSFVTGETTRFQEQVTNVYLTLFSVEGSWVTIVPLCVVIVPLLAALVRRLHDLGRSGWWAFVALFLLFGLEPLVRAMIEFLALSVPIVALVASLLLGFPTFVLSSAALIVLVLWTANEGEPEINEFGPKPTGILV